MRRNVRIHSSHKPVIVEFRVLAVDPVDLFESCGDVSSGPTHQQWAPRGIVV
jgi:hypothetical protein